MQLSTGELNTQQQQKSTDPPRTCKIENSEKVSETEMSEVNKKRAMEREGESTGLEFQ